MYDQVVKCQRAGLCLSEHFLILVLKSKNVTQTVVDFVCQGVVNIISSLAQPRKVVRCAAVPCVNWAHKLCSDGSDVFICPVCEDGD